jgi:hypothetical protein
MITKEKQEFTSGCNFTLPLLLLTVSPGKESLSFEKAYGIVQKGFFPFPRNWHA